MSTARVAVFGAGVGGLTAAHELAKGGSSIDVYERRKKAHFGGKSRSLRGTMIRADGADLSRDDERDPREHGLRFFPGFYRYLPALMKQIPYNGGRGGVWENLVPAREGLFAADDAFIPLPTKLLAPGSLEKAVLGVLGAARLGIPPDQLAFFASRLLVLLTSCDDRRYKQWEKKSWWDFVKVKGKHKNYEKYLADGMTRRLVAAHAKELSARTGGLILLQLLNDFSGFGAPGRPPVDRLLNGPTNEVWIDPWVAHLESLGVRFHDQVELTAIRTAGDRVSSMTVSTPAGPSAVKADYYISAVPVEVMARLVTPEIKDVEPRLKDLGGLAARSRWMNGIQFYLNRRVPIIPGHVIYPDAEFALTSISQAQFWPEFDTIVQPPVKDILSVVISDWETDGVSKKKAKDLTAKQIRDDVWAQLTRALNRGGVERLPDDSRLGFLLDDSIVPADPPKPSTNLEPMLINYRDSWKSRPDAATKIDNLFLAADYVQTYTDLATMEAACEAGRKAYNGIVTHHQAGAGKHGHEVLPVDPLPEPAIFRSLRDLDQELWDRGIGHQSQTDPAAWEAKLMAIEATMP